MTSLLNTVLVLVMVMNLFALGTSRIQAVISIVAAQGAILGAFPLLVHQHLTPSVLLIALAAVAIKGIVIPTIMRRALRDAQIKREVEPLIGFLPSILLGAVATAFAIVLAGQLPLASRHENALLVPASITTVLAGFILLTTRFNALNQVIGYLVLENGIFIFGMLLIEAMPLVVEMGVLLDLFVGIFVICIIVNRINREFTTVDERPFGAIEE